MKILRIMLLVLLSIQTSHAAQAYLTYADFLQRVKAGQVKSVTLGKYSAITGVIIVDGKEQAFQSFGQVGTSNDPLLTDLLSEKSVATNFSSEANPMVGGSSVMMLSGFTMLLGPWVALILLILCYIRLGKVLQRLNEKN
ncbi:MAG: hypothetical protein LV480_00100 [Methylacidiphilales bacterium]|nr:hypothetical protein [Candidatus Methylacidiphilales bacterium]